MNEPGRRILWTGGFDSTWLTIDALLAGYRVEAPIYRGYGVGVATWQKPANEDEARRRITHGLPSDLRRRLVPIEVDVADHAAWNDVWARLTADATAWWPTQTYMIGALPKLVGPVEAAFVASDRTTHAGILPALGRLGVTAPIVDRTKAELLADAKARGFAHLLGLTWSCECSVAGANEAGCDACPSRVLPASPYRVA